MEGGVEMDGGGAGAAVVMTDGAGRGLAVEVSVS